MALFVLTVQFIGWTIVGIATLSAIEALILLITGDKQ